MELSDQLVKAAFESSFRYEDPTLVSLVAYVPHPPVNVRPQLFKRSIRKGRCSKSDCKEERDKILTVRLSSSSVGYTGPPLPNAIC